MVCTLASPLRHSLIDDAGALLPFRLAHVAIQCPQLSHAALTLAIDLTKKGKDVQMYNRLTELAAALDQHDLATVDTDWASRKDEENRRELSRLEGELRGYKNNLIRESIRMGQEDIAIHHLLTGGPVPDPSNPQTLSSSGYNAAWLAFGKMRDYCTTPTHVNSMNLRQLHTSFVQAAAAQLSGQSQGLAYSTVNNHASRLLRSGVKDEEQSKLNPIAHVAQGIALLGSAEYRAAANAFIQTPFEYHNLGVVHNMEVEKQLATANDVAIYGGLCALATMTREELVKSVLGGPFRAFLEQEPHLRKAISEYTTAKYQSCINTLRRYYSDWSLDLFLGASNPSIIGTHVDRLFARIRERSITAYFSSFSEVSLSSLASTFPPTSSSPDAMEREVLGMIESGALDARLDVVNGILIAPHKELRHTTHQDAKKAAEDVERTLLLRLHKVNMSLAGLEVPRSKGGWDGARMGNGF